MGLVNANTTPMLLRLVAQKKLPAEKFATHHFSFDQFMDAYPHELSGGMRQRVALARAFAIQPELLLADEAFGHLDEVTAAALRRTFLDLARTEGNTAVLVTHQLEEAIEMGGRILVFGKPATLLADIRLETRPAEALSRLRTTIQRMLESNQPDPEPLRNKELTP